MSTSNTPTTFGATIVKPASKPPAAANDSASLQPPTLDTTSLTPRISQDVPSITESPSLEYHEKTFPIYSPFYQHPPASFERVPHSRQGSKANVSAMEKDLEAGAITPITPDDDNPFTSKISVDRNKECKMWPSKQTLMQKRLAEKKKKRDERKNCRACAPVRERWIALSKKQQLAIEIGLAVFIVGVIVAIAVGITKAVNGSVYESQGNSAPLEKGGS